VSWSLGFGPEQKDPLMKSKQLANVLVKVLGLSVCLHGVPSFVTGFVRGFLSGISPSAGATTAAAAGSSSTYMIGALVELALGVVLIWKSKAISEFLLRGDDE
jgi:hypothetical protein